MKDILVGIFGVIGVILGIATIVGLILGLVYGFGWLVGWVLHLMVGPNIVFGMTFEQFIGLIFVIGTVVGSSRTATDKKNKENIEKLTNKFKEYRGY